ncbi:MAG TPA: gamma-glutamyl-gamma-aminobutyrate hydrolase family protein [Acidimicrobiales bacterium]|nr:gamma-glutamyl-gamma-aminobutyrate hydrolase family protein [Acidimicrobiales bacterium]
MATGVPVVGISAYEAEASWGVWHTRAALLPLSYVRHVAAAGGAPVLLPSAGDAASVVARLDALILSGGPDVDPARYGAEAHPRTQPPQAARDEHEMALWERAAERGLPTLAICRGLQLVNVARGGTLHQHLPDVVGGEDHGPAPGVFGRTAVRVLEDSLLARVLGSTRTVVACHHHQGIDRLAEGLEAVAWGEDGTVEAVEDPRAPGMLAVQWHPEEGEDPSLFAWLVRAAAARS